MVKEKETGLRIAEALERLAPSLAASDSLLSANAFVWVAETQAFRAVAETQSLPLELLLGMDSQKEMLLANTKRFTKNLPANNALLWGARGTGKSSLVKSVHRELNQKKKNSLVLIEVAREDIASLPRLLLQVRIVKRQFLIFCDDLSFDQEDTSYKSLKSVLEGGIEGKPDNVLFYATSNRRHLMPREFEENETARQLNPGETVEEKVSLSDRFGLWLGFHHLDQATYLSIVDTYAAHFKLKSAKKSRDREALEWATTRGSRSGRVAWQFTVDLAGRLGKKLF